MRIPFIFGENYRMRYLAIGFLICVLSSCREKTGRKVFTAVTIEVIYEDSLSIRAIELMPGSLAFAANKGIFGAVDLTTHTVRTRVQDYDSVLPEFRSVAHTGTDFFMLSVASPALLYKTGDGGSMDLVYLENDSLVFYDAMKFWNDREGIAVGDRMEGCLSVIITRDGGHTWNKLPCSLLPGAAEGEGAFAASNTNIAIHGSRTWIGTTAGRVYYSGDKGGTWAVYDTPIASDKPTQGIYSLDFYNDELGIAVGGDYTDPENAMSNKALSTDGGKTWELISNGKEPPYKSCVQFVPDAEGKEIVAVGFTGISYSANRGRTWNQLSDASFYTIRFLNDSIAYAAGKNKIAKITFQ